jgi:uncharacterized phage-associated protein
VYYSQAWSLVWDEAPLFGDHIEAWANGPVVPRLYRAHRGRFQIGQHQLPTGDPEALSRDQRETVDSVIEFYGSHTPQWLSDLTHAEDPWKGARDGLNPGQRGSREITVDALAEYYGSL